MMIFDKDKAISLFLYICIILPAGSVFGVNVKILSLLFVVLAVMVYQKGIYIYKIIFFSTPIITFLTFEILYSYVTGYRSEYILIQAKDIFVFFLIVVICTVSLPKNEMESIAVKVIVRGLCVASCIKIIMLSFSFISGIPVSQVVGIISGFFKVTLMSLDVEDSSIGRVNFTSDAILPFALFITASKVLKGNRDKKKYIASLLLFLLLSFSALISMSRFYWATSILSVILAAIGTINKSKSFISILVIVLIVIFSLGSSSVQNMVSSRFSAHNNDNSDGARVVQYKKISHAIDNHPIMGGGLGYYIPDYIRSDDAKYSYELQIPALIMQIGFFGTAILIFGVLIACFNYYRYMSFYYRVCYLIFIFIWLSSGVFNPVLFSSSGGVVFLLMIAMPRIELFKR